MKSQALKLLPALGLALTLGACASMPDPQPGEALVGNEPFAGIEPGVTRADVLSLEGEPAKVITNAQGETTWVYPRQDASGAPLDYDVTFGPSPRGN
jgi:hypothetical protein